MTLLLLAGAIRSRRGFHRVGTMPHARPIVGAAPDAFKLGMMAHMSPPAANVPRPRPKPGELVAITRDVLAAGARKGQTGKVVSATEDAVTVELDDDAGGGTPATVVVPRDAIFRVQKELARAEATSAEATATNVKWVRFSWGGLIAVIIVAVLTMVIPVLRLVRKADKIGQPGATPNAPAQQGSGGR